MLFIIDPSDVVCKLNKMDFIVMQLLLVIEESTQHKLYKHNLLNPVFLFKINNK